MKVGQWAKSRGRRHFVPDKALVTDINDQSNNDLDSGEIEEALSRPGADKWISAMKIKRENL